VLNKLAKGMSAADAVEHAKVMAVMSERREFALVHGTKELQEKAFAYPIVGDQYGLDYLAEDLMEIDQSAMTALFCYADGRRRDGVGDLLNVEGIDTSRHVRVPNILFDHGKGAGVYGSWPIALGEDRDTRAYTNDIDPSIQKARIKAFFYQGKGIDGPVNRADEYEFALHCQQIFDLCVRGFFRSGSIGYQIMQGRELPPDYEQGIQKGVHLIRVKMLEASIVITPANQDTVGKSFSHDPVRELICKDGVCGKPLSGVLRKSLEPYMGKKVEQLGWEPRNHDCGCEVKSMVKKKSFATNPLESRTDYENPLSNSEVPNSDWKPGLGAKGVKYITHDGSHWTVHAESGRVLGEHPTKEAAEAQLRAVEANKHKAKSLRKKYRKCAVQEKLNESFVDDQLGDTVDQDFPSNDVGLKVKSLRAKYKAFREVGGELGTAAGVEGGPVGMAAGGAVGEKIGSKIDEKLDEKSKDYKDNPTESRTGYQNPLSDAPKGRNIAARKLPVSGKKLKDVRLKYRAPARRRFRKSIAGISHMSVRSKDVEAARQAAESKGVKFLLLGPGDPGIDRVKLMGDDSCIDEIARTFGKGLNMRTKSVAPLRTVPDKTGREREAISYETQLNSIGGTEEKGIKAIRVHGIELPDIDSYRSREEYVRAAFQDAMEEFERTMTTEQATSSAKQVADVARKEWDKQAAPSRSSQRSGLQAAYGPRFGGPSKSKGTKNMRAKTKSNPLEEVNKEEESQRDDEAAGKFREEDEEMNGGAKALESYGAQSLRKIHNDHKTLMNDYEDMLQVQDHTDVRKHLEKLQEHHAKTLDETERLFSKHFKHLPPLEDAEDHEEDEIEAGEKDLEEPGQEGADAADSKEDMPPVAENPEEVKEPDEEKSLRLAKVKQIDARVNRLQAMRKGLMGAGIGGAVGAVAGGPLGAAVGGAAGSAIDGEGSDEKKCAKCSKSKAKCNKCSKAFRGIPERKTQVKVNTKDIPSDEGIENGAIPGEEADVQEEESGHEPEQVKGLKPHHKEMVNEAAGYMKEMAQPGSNMGEEERMKAYHFHKNLDSICNVGTKSEFEGDLDWHEEESREPNHKSAENTIPGTEADRQEAESGHEPEGVKDLGGDGENPDYDAETIGKIQAASKHLKMMSRERAYGDAHREAMAHHAKELDAMGQMENMDKIDEVNEPGEIGEKDGSDRIRGRNKPGQIRAMWHKDPENPYSDDGKGMDEDEIKEKRLENVSKLEEMSNRLDAVLGRFQLNGAA
jgi:hypothetical protein